MKKFVLSNSKVNSYGFRLLTSGCDLTRFEANPVMLYNHKIGADRERLPLGAWDGLAIEGDDLVGVPDFDMEDPFAATISRKVDKGHLRGASVGFDVIEVSNDPSVMLAGQTLPTVTKWAPFEASIVDIPSNEEALCLRHNGELILLTGETDLRTLSFFQTDTPNTDKMKNYPTELLTILSLGEGATDEQVLAAIKALSKAKEDAETKLAAEAKRVADEAKAHIETEATRLKLSADEKTHLLSLAETSPELARKTIGMMGERKTLSSMAGGNANAGNPSNSTDTDERSEWGYEDWAKKDSKGLLFMKKNDPERFETLLAAQKKANLTKL